MKHYNFIQCSSVFLYEKEIRKVETWIYVEERDTIEKDNARANNIRRTTRHTVNP